MTAAKMVFWGAKHNAPRIMAMCMAAAAAEVAIVVVVVVVV